MCKFSLVLPCYNVTQYIKKCLDSIFHNSQKYPYQLEVILVDDGSKDRFADVVSGYFDVDITEQRMKFSHDGHEVIVIRKQNAGLSVARNDGMDAATGDFIVFIDPDDYLLDGYFDYVWTVAQECDFDVLLMGFIKCKEDAEGNQTDQKPIFPMQTYCYGSNAEIVKGLLPQYLGSAVCDVQSKGALLAKKEHGGVWRSVYRRAFLNEHSLRFTPGLKFNEDKMFNAWCMTMAERVETRNEVFYCYTIRPAGLFSKRNGPDILKNKMLSLEIRAEIVKTLNQKGYAVGVEAYAASNVFSVLELMNVCSFRQKGQILAYIRHPDVVEAISITPYIRRMKFDVPLFLLKHHLEVVLFICVRMARKFGIKFSI